jgi:phosphatidylserine/phosphatidylglycerophosphate/cardiolipin synthase-like enzyme
MNRLLPLVFLAIFFAQASSPLAGEINSRVAVFFSPKGGCTQAVVEELGKAHETVVVQAYSFTSAPIAKALVEAHQRGVRVEVLLDKSQRTERYSSATFLSHAGIATFIDGRHAIAHNKVMVIDAQTVLTGSFNFTKAAEEKNAENLLVLRGKELAAKYTANWREHRQHSEPYTGPTAKTSEP